MTDNYKKTIQDLILLLNEMKDIDFDLTFTFFDETEFSVSSAFFIEAQELELGKGKDKKSNLSIKYRENAFIINTMEIPIDYIVNVDLNIAFFENINKEAW